MSREPEIAAILKGHESTANGILNDAGSQLLYDKFISNTSGILALSASVSGSLLTLDISATKSTVDGWISELQTCIEEAWRNYDSEDDESGAEFMRIQRMQWDVNEATMSYNNLKYDLDDIELDFENAVRLYRSPVRSALTDISILYNAENGVNGDFSGFTNVSVYVHGIEDTGEDFFNSAKDAAHDGDIIVFVQRDGKKLYSRVVVNRDGKTIIEYNENLTELMNDRAFMHKEGRIHLIYETTHENEHRQETSDDLALELNKMGLMNGETKIDMFGHSYGGRRSLQFAMDYPDNVRSITTVGTPYDTNFLATAANNVRWAAELGGKDPKNTSDYLDFNENNRNNKDGMDYSNAYTDMTSEPLSDDIHQLKSANPEIYRKLEEMDITAVAGYRTEYTVSYSPYYYGPPQEYKTNSDDTVSVKSQNAEILGDLIDERPQIEVEGTNMFNPGHVYEVEDEDFIKIIKEVNIKQME